MHGFLCLQLDSYARYIPEICNFQTMSARNVNCFFHCNYFHFAAYSLFKFFSQRDRERQRGRQRQKNKIKEKYFYNCNSVNFRNDTDSERERQCVFVCNEKQKSGHEFHALLLPLLLILNQQIMTCIFKCKMHVLCVRITNTEHCTIN